MYKTFLQPYPPDANTGGHRADPPPHKPAPSSLLKNCRNGMGHPPFLSQQHYGAAAAPLYQPESLSAKARSSREDDKVMQSYYW